jgi:hypothetical protein
MKVELQQLKIDILRFLFSYFTKDNALCIERENPFRRPTHKEERKHHHLIEKQRKRFNGK